MKNKKRYILGKGYMTYEEVCHELGFDPSVNFVKITTRGSISFTVGKPYEINALYKSVCDNGFYPSKSLYYAMTR